MDRHEATPGPPRQPSRGQNRRTVLGRQTTRGLKRRHPTRREATAGRTLRRALLATISDDPQRRTAGTTHQPARRVNVGRTPVVVLSSHVTSWPGAAFVCIRLQAGRVQGARSPDAAEVRVCHRSIQNRPLVVESKPASAFVRCIPSHYISTATALFKTVPPEPVWHGLSWPSGPSLTGP